MSVFIMNRLIRVVFSEINDDFIYSALPAGLNPKTTKLELFEVIEEHMKKVSNIEEKITSAA